jgi:hypothetical protein
MSTGTGYFGLPFASLAGLLLTGLGLSMTRAAPSRRRLGVALMGVGTALVFLGFWLGSRQD